MPLAHWQNQSPLLRLPQETIDDILDDCMDAFCALSPREYALICRAFLKRCQQRLFSTITITPQTYCYEKEYSWVECSLDEGTWVDTVNYRLETLSYILNKSPHLAGYICCLRLDIGATGGENVDWRDPLAALVMQLLRSLRDDHNLKPLEVTLFATYSGTDFVNVSSFKDDFAQPHIVPFVTVLRLENLNKIPPGFLKSCRHMKKLSLVDIHPDLEYDWSDEDGRGLPKVEELEYYTSDDMLTTLIHGIPPLYMPFIDFSRLRILKTNTVRPGQAVEVAQKIMNLAAESLEELNLPVVSMPVERDPDWPDEGYIKGKSVLAAPKASTSHLTLNFANASYLRRFHLDLIFEGPPTVVDDNPITQLCNILKTIPSSNNFKRISVRLYIGFRESIEPETCLDLDWPIFASEVSRISGGKRLYVRLDIQFKAFIIEAEGDDREGKKSTDILKKRCEQVFGREIREILERGMAGSSVTLSFDHTVEGAVLINYWFTQDGEGNGLDEAS